MSSIPCFSNQVIQDTIMDEEKLDESPVTSPLWVDNVDELKIWEPKFFAAQGVSKDEINYMIEKADIARKDSKDTGAMMVKLAPVLKPGRSKGEAYKSCVTDLTRVFGAIDRLFKLGGEAAYKLTLVEYREGIENPVRLDNKAGANKRQLGMKGTEAASTLTEAEVAKTGITFDVIVENKDKMGGILTTSKVTELFGDLNKCHGMGRMNERICKKFGFGKQHGFISAALTAWSEHYPLELTVDDFWIIVVQGIATHVEQNSEALRSKFVKFKGKKTLEVDNDEISPRNLSNDWTPTIDGWVQLIENNLVTDALNVSFSTTTRMSQIVQRVGVMDVCKSFFAYRCRTCCGFPSITLRGTRQDWVDLEKRSTRAITELCKSELSAKWVPALKSVFAKFIECWNQDYKADTHFWDRMIKRGATGGSGGYSWYTGWFNVFFPYLGTGEANSFCTPYDPKIEYSTGEGRWVGPGQGGTSVSWREEGRRGPECGDFPTGQAVAPVEWDYLGQQIPLSLKAGFFGVSQNPDTRALKPFLTWAIVDKDDKKQKRNVRGW